MPLAVAVGLGVSKISSEWSEANRLASAADNVEVIPVVTGLSAATSTVAGSQVINIGGRSLVTEENLVDLDKAIAETEDAIGALADLPSAQQPLQEMLDQAKEVRALGLSPTPLPPLEARDQIDRYRSNGVEAVEQIVAQVSDPQIDAAKLRLVDALNMRSTMLGEVVGLAVYLQDREVGTQTYLVATNTERALLALLAERFPADDRNINDLRQGIEAREGMLTGPAAESGQLPLGEARQSILSSLDTTEALVAFSTDDIVGGVRDLADTARSDAIMYSIVVLLTILAALLLAVFVARSMIVPLHRLRLAALRVAESDLPHEVAQLRNGASPEQVPLEPMPIRSEEEIGQLARAVDDIHGQALRLASDQAQMRTQVNDMFETLARRSKSLVDHQLTLIEAMEYDEKDPRLLENLFRLDHLAARMRRNGDNLLILAGTKQRRSKSAPVEIADVLRAAISEVEDYERVKLGATPRGSLKEPSASDLAHLFAELLDNALRASPPETDVKFTFAQAHDQGLLIEVADRGIGMPPTEMAEINRRLETTAEPGPDTARHMGLFVVGRLAERHGLTVRLRPTFDTARDPGVTVTVHVPVGLIVADKSGSGPLVPQPSPAPAGEPQRPSAPSSMQMRSVSRTPGGNMMVTVDPGVSGPISAGAEDRAAAANASVGPATPGGGLPQRQPGSAMASGLRGEAEQSGATLRPPTGQQGTGPQRGKLAAASMPKRSVVPGGPVPPRPGGPQAERPAATPPSRDPNSGLPQRQPGSNGVPQPTGGLPLRESGAGEAPQPDVSGGLPQRGPGGLPQRQPGQAGPGGLPQREAGQNGLAPREAGPSGLPQREAGPSGLPQREPSAGGVPPREAGPSGLPQREPSTGGLPQREAGNSGLPQREAGASGLPQREPSAGSLPQREPGQNGPAPREAGPNGLPLRAPGQSGLPQRQPAADRSGEIEAVGGLANGSAQPGLPPRRPDVTQRHTELPQRQMDLPQRSTELPQRQTDLPQRSTGSGGGLPQRQPGGNGLPPRVENAPGVALPQRDGGAQPVANGAHSEPNGSGDAGRDRGRHSHRANPERTASFFQTRLQPAEESGDPVMGGTPIFAEMMSAWLSDPNADRSQAAASFESPGDEGWQAAQRASEAKPTATTAAGLPQRNPGGRLVPGAVSGAVDRAPSRDPETIRSSLSRHQQGVRDGRAMKAMNLTGDKGDR
ncbi:HAMP domain-containing protein [Nocardia cyriacigeorgica]|uniref:histidine kinase n=1 Tax=Nocardia cyriacigeorgica TaxID=135487 RepID=A0A6P1D3U6_9NOCA|nr:HAMP domain-containing protein [Nocardia cyriacigeorgica]NEW43810.1 HAMP domain-containing protein [Nocardia cyriacigeorgica]NEW50371.1 HAMP domain-containing protein [Nocardia cyriacigeorgica]NEW54889.1 HAMP domain-containing protein [Nocardia cyriacigeorgica]